MAKAKKVVKKINICFLTEVDETITKDKLNQWALEKIQEGLVNETLLEKVTITTYTKGKK